MENVFLQIPYARSITLLMEHVLHVIQVMVFLEIHVFKECLKIQTVRHSKEQIVKTVLMASSLALMVNASKLVHYVRHSILDLEPA